MKINDRLGAVRRSAVVWYNAALLAVFPFTDQILQGLNDALPSLAPYMPANVYKTVGFVVVAINMIRAIRRAHRKAQDKGGAHG